MSEHSADRGGPGVPQPSLPTLWRGASLAQELWAGLAWGAIAAAAVAVFLYFWLFEAGLADAVFATAVTLAIGAAIACICRQPLVAAVLVLAMVGIVRTISYAKQQASEVVLHAYDLVTFARSWSGLQEAWSEQRTLVLGVAIALFAAAAASWAAVRLEAPRVPRRYAAGALGLLVGIAWMADAARGPRRHTEFYFESAYVTFFYTSWSETAQALWRGGLIEAGGREAMPPHEGRLEVPARCSPATRPPHIVLIHQESVVPPALFPTLSYDRSLDPFFLSLDGKLNKLRVETYGGASWLTEFSLLTGLSTQSFGGMRQFVQHMMAGGIADTLPQALGRCGYRNVMLYPMLRHFLGAGRFFEAVGFAEIIDAKAQGAKLANERDRFYYANALSEIDRHVAASERPLFLYIQTMAAHGPYDYA